MIEVVEHGTWLEARCPQCDRYAVALGPDRRAELALASLQDLIGHARVCRPAAADPDTLLQRLMAERYPMTRG